MYTYIYMYIFMGAGVSPPLRTTFAKLMTFGGYGSCHYYEFYYCNDYDFDHYSDSYSS